MNVNLSVSITKKKRLNPPLKEKLKTHQKVKNEGMEFLKESNKNQLKQIEESKGGFCGVWIMWKNRWFAF